MVENLGIGQPFRKDRTSSFMKCNQRELRGRSKRSYPAGSKDGFCSGAREATPLLYGCRGYQRLPDAFTAEGGFELTLGDLVSEEERVLVFALEVLPIPSLPEGCPATSLEGEALLWSSDSAAAFLGGAVGDALGRCVEGRPPPGEKWIEESDGTAGRPGRRAPSRTTRSSRCGSRSL